MTDPKEKPRPSLRAPKPKKTLGLSVPSPLKMPHAELIRPESTVGESPRVGDSTPVELPRVGDSTPVETPIHRKTRPRTVDFPSLGESPRVGDSPRVRISVPWKDGELRLPNYLLFNLYPHLPLDERAVYQELYLWTIGFGRTERRLSRAKLCKSLQVTDKTLGRILKMLVAKGLVEIGDTHAGGPRDQRGTLFRVFLPDVHGKPEEERTPGKSPTVGNSPTHGNFPNMEIEKKGIENGVYGIRTIAARLFEVHRNDPGFDRERLRELVIAALVGQGTQADDALVDEAIRGMAEG